MRRISLDSTGPMAKSLSEIPSSRRFHRFYSFQPLITIHKSALSPKVLAAFSHSTAPLSFLNIHYLYSINTLTPRFKEVEHIAPAKLPSGPLTTHSVECDTVQANAGRSGPILFTQCPFHSLRHATEVRTTHGVEGAQGQVYCETIRNPCCGLHRMSSFAVDNHPRATHCS